MRELTVTVIIPTYKPGETFDILMKRLRGQSKKPDRILIINTEEAYFREKSVENTPNLEVRHIKKEEFDHGGTRDLGAGMAQTDLLLYMTMDAIPADRDLIRNLCKPFANPEVGASYARQLPGKDCSELERYAREFNYGAQSRIKTKDDLETLGIKTFFCSNVCAAYRRDIYRELGGFEKRIIFNEDMVYAWKLIRAGYKIAYCAEAKVIHSHNYTGLQQFHRNFDLGVSQAAHPEIFGAVKSEGEGARLVKGTAGSLIRKGKPWLIFRLIWISGMKYAGYFLGKHFRYLPGAVVRRCTMNPSYWEKKD